MRRNRQVVAEAQADAGFQKGGSQGRRGRPHRLSAGCEYHRPLHLHHEGVRIRQDGSAFDGEAVGKEAVSGVQPDPGLLEDGVDLRAAGDQMA